MKAFILVSCFLVVFCQGASGQWRAHPLPGRSAMQPSAPYESDILSARPVWYLVAAGFGAQAYRHEGSFSPSCKCEFSGARDVMFWYGGEFSIEFPKLQLAVKAQLTYVDFSSKFERTGTRSSVIVGDDPDAEVEYRNSSEVQLSYISFAPIVAWFIGGSRFYTQVGLDVRVPVTARYDHVEDILTSGWTYYDGSTRYTLLGEQDIPGSDRPGFGVHAGIGYELIFSDRVIIAPELSAVVPLTAVSPDHPSWKVATQRFSVYLKVRI